MEKQKLKNLGVWIVMIFGLLNSSCQSNPDQIQLEASPLPQMVYPKYRRWMSPDNGDNVRFQSPSLQWPSKKNQIFDIRIARDKTFEQSLIEINNIPFSLYNLHQDLANGVWYWQYRSKNEPWSKVAFFNVNEASIDFVPPSFESLYSCISKSHPRVLVQKGKWKQLISKASGYEETQNIIQKANEIIGSRIPSELDAITQLRGRDKKETNKIEKVFSQKVGDLFGRSLHFLTKAYVLTLNEKYFIEAQKWIKKATLWDAKGLTHINDFGDSYIMESLALALDVFWEKMEDKELQAILLQITSRAQGFYNHWVNYLENRNSSMHVWQHILHRMFLTSIALIDEVPEAVNWLEYIYELWLAQHPKMGSEDGAWFNGTGYIRMNVMTMIDIPLKLGQLTNKNFFVVPWYQNFMKWLSYAYPPGASSDGFCNDGNKWPIPNYEYGAFSDAIARVIQDPLALKYSHKVFDILEQLKAPIIDKDYTAGSVNPSTLSEDMDYAWFRITQGYDMPLPSGDKAIELPNAAIFPDVGVAYMNTDLKDVKNNLRISVKSSPMGPLAHTHAEQNTFNIAYKGKRLFYNSGYRPWMGAPHTQEWYKHTRGHNGILVDNYGQPYDAGAFGFLPRFINGEKINYVLGDASHAYKAYDLSPKTRKDNTPDNLGIKYFRRHFLLLKPDIFLVYDEMEANKPVDWSWLIHNYHGLKMDAQNKTVETTYKDFGGRVSLFGSSPVEYTITDQFSVDPKNVIRKTDVNGEILEYKNQWHFSAKTKKKVSKMRFLAVIQVSNDLNYPQVLRLENGNKFEVSDWIITANMNTVTNGEIKVESKDRAIRFSSHEGIKGEKSLLLEKINGKEIVTTVTDNYPKSIISASKRF